MAEALFGHNSIHHINMFMLVLLLKSELKLWHFKISRQILNRGENWHHTLLIDNHYVPLCVKIQTQYLMNPFNKLMRIIFSFLKEKK